MRGAKLIAAPAQCLAAGHQAGPMQEEGGIGAHEQANKQTGMRAGKHMQQSFCR